MDPIVYLTTLVVRVITTSFVRTHPLLTHNVLYIFSRSTSLLFFEQSLSISDSFPFPGISNKPIIIFTILSGLGPPETIRFFTRIGISVDPQYLQFFYLLCQSGNIVWPTPQTCYLNSSTVRLYLRNLPVSLSGVSLLVTTLITLPSVLFLFGV